MRWAIWGNIDNFCSFAIGASSQELTRNPRNIGETILAHYHWLLSMQFDCIRLHVGWDENAKFAFRACKVRSFKTERQMIASWTTLIKNGKNSPGFNSVVFLKVHGLLCSKLGWISRETDRSVTQVNRLKQHVNQPIDWTSIGRRKMCNIRTSQLTFGIA